MIWNRIFFSGIEYIGSNSEHTCVFTEQLMKFAHSTVENLLTKTQRLEINLAISCLLICMPAKSHFDASYPNQIYYTALHSALQWNINLSTNLLIAWKCWENFPFLLCYILTNKIFVPSHHNQTQYHEEVFRCEPVISLAFGFVHNNSHNKEIYVRTYILYIV